MKNGMKIYYIIQGYVMESEIYDYDGETFKIVGLAGCEGPTIINKRQVGKTVFKEKVDALINKDHVDCYLVNHC